MIRGRQRYKTHTGMVTQHNHLFPQALTPVNLRWKERCTAASWGDHSGNSNHASQTTTADQAEASGGGWDFESDDSSNHYDLAAAIDVDGTHGFAIAFVCEIESMTSTMCLVSVAGGTSHVVEFLAGKDNIRIKFDTGATSISPGDGTLNDFLHGQGKFVVTIVRDAGSTGNIHIYKNGVLLPQDSQAATPNGEFELQTIGTRNNDRYFDGKLYDFIVLDSGSSTWDTNYIIPAMNSYLCAKHGISEERPDLS